MTTLSLPPAAAVPKYASRHSIVDRLHHNRVKYSYEIRENEKQVTGFAPVIP